MAMWVLSGAEVAWLIDPERRVVEISRTGASVEEHYDPTSIQGT